ncbi:MAG: hypothetical protein ACRC1T_02315 [Clostridium chrysemydis]|uniref:hypothetical protein n=1 Tax=Clostridium chrysemydis TaxID=2665504 RepID=UPI003F37C6D3
MPFNKILKRNLFIVLFPILFGILLIFFSKSYLDSNYIAYVLLLPFVAVGGSLLEYFITSFKNKK